MKHAISIVLLVATFASGVVVGGWKSHIVTALKGWIGLQDSLFDSPHYRSRLAFFRQAPGYADVIMLGDSITEGVDWRELFPDVRILNRGISGDTSTGVLNRLDEVIGRRPKRVFLMIGSNDLQTGVPVPTINSNIRSIVGALEQKKIRVVLQKTLYVTSRYRPQINGKVKELNDVLSDLCTSRGTLCLDLNQTLADGGALSSSFSSDGLHLNSAGYFAWKKEIADLLLP